MYRFQTRGLQWSVGAFLVILGTLFLIAPHQFSFLPAPHLSRLPLYGLVTLFLGVALTGVSVSVQPRWAASGVQILAAGLLAWLAFLNYSIGAYITASNSALLAAALFLIGLLPQSGGSSRPGPRTSSFGLMMALGALLTGTLLLHSGPLIAVSPIFRLSNAILQSFGSTLLFVGGWLLLACLRLLFVERDRNLFWSFFERGSFFFCGIIFLLFWLTNSQTSRVWAGATYFGVFGAVLAFLPLTQMSLFPFGLTTLRTRMALILGMATAVPLILTMAQVSQNEEASTRRDALQRQELRAAALSRNITDYIRLHRAALRALARQPNLMQHSPAELQALLDLYQQSFPDIEAFYIYNASGEMVAGTAAPTAGTVVASGLNFEATRQSGAATLAVTRSPAYPYPILGFAEPVWDAQNNFAGAMTFEMISQQLLELIEAHRPGQPGRAYLVDAEGRVLAHPDSALETALADLSARAPVSSILARNVDQGFLTYSDGATEMFTGFALVNELNWWIVIERSADDAMQGIYNSRDLTFGFLLLFIVLAMLLGYFLAGWLTNPLQQLLTAVTGLAMEDVTVPLPNTELAEIQRLVAAFDRLRNRLSKRTAERERAIQELQQAKTDLERRVAERTHEIQEYANRLESSNEELENFAFVASHDMQEPLRKIEIFGDLLNTRFATELPSEGQEYVRRMQNAAERMSQMIEALLLYSRVSTQRQPFKPVDLNALAREVLNDLEARLAETGGQVTVETLPIISADKIQIRQLLQNLISNALKFHRPRVAPQVSISARRLSANCFELLVKDNGIGFEMERVDYLFQMFHRLHGRSQFPGTGMGLAICRKIAERHGGSIQAVSQPGEGSTFIVTLPLTES